MTNADAVVDVLSLVLPAALACLLLLVRPSSLGDDARSRNDSTPSAQRAPRFRSLQVLRGVAIALVFVFHLNIDGVLPGGFLGVDVFFVLSGYLVAGLRIIVPLVDDAGDGDESDTPVFSLSTFFARRVRRLLPASAVALFATLALELVLGDYAERDDLWNVAASFVYASNVASYRGAVSYFDADDARNFVLHFWSLAVEEQYYVVAPLLCIAVVRLCGAVLPATSVVWRRAIVLVGLACIVCISAFACVSQVLAAQPARFFLLPFRAWQFAAGALVAVVQTWYMSTADGVETRDSSLSLMPNALLVRRAAFYASLVALLVLSAVHDGSHAPDWSALCATALTCVFLLVRYESYARPLFAPLEWLGELSYSVYLYHWPLSRVLRFCAASSSTAWYAATVTLSTLLCALASYVAIEQPAMRTRRSNAYWLVCAAIVACAGATLSLFLLSTAPATLPNANALAVDGTPVVLFEMDSTVTLPRASLDDASAQANRSQWTMPELARSKTPHRRERYSPTLNALRWKARYAFCPGTTNKGEDSEVTAEGTVDPKKPCLVLVGDSHALALCELFSVWSRLRGYNFLHAIHHWHPHDPGNAIDSRSRLFHRRVPQSPSPAFRQCRAADSVAVLSASTSSRWQLLNQSSSIFQDAVATVRHWGELAHKGVLLVRDVPSFSFSCPLNSSVFSLAASDDRLHCLAGLHPRRDCLFKNRPMWQCARPLAATQSRLEDSLKRRAFFNDTRVQVLAFDDLIGDSDGWLHVSRNGVPTYMDTAHLNVDFLRANSQSFLKRISRGIHQLLV